MFVDLVHHGPDGRPMAVIDAKYKVSSPDGRFANADHYQMLAYCTALGVDTAWLVYAAGDQQPRRRRIKNSPVTVIEYPLDLSQHPIAMLAHTVHIASLCGRR